MTEPPGARLRVGLSALTVAEYFRDAEGKDVLLFIDNIFRFTQAGSEVSALLGRMPSAVGYQPTLLSEMGEMQERITSTKKGSITSVQAIYVPGRRLHRPGAGDDLRAPRRDDQPVARDFRARDLSGGRSAGVDLAHSRPAHPRRGALRRRPAGEADPAALQGPAGHHRDSRHRRAVGRRPADRCRARARSRSSCRSRSSSRSSSPASKASTCRSPTRSAGSRRSSKASTTRSPSRTSTWPARSTKSSRSSRSASVMALPTKLQLQIVSADRSLVNETVDEVEIPGSDGYFGVLPGHTPLLALLARRRALVPAGAGEALRLDRVRVRRGAARSGHDPGADCRKGRRNRPRARRGGEEARRGAARAADRGHRCRAGAHRAAEVAHPPPGRDSR